MDITIWHNFKKGPIIMSSVIIGTPLHAAVSYDQKETVRALLNAGADVNKKDYAGRTPLFYAKTIDMAQLLIKNKATIDPNDLAAHEFHMSYYNERTQGALRDMIKTSVSRS